MTFRTIPELYHHQVEHYGDRISSYHKDTTTRRWVATSWRDGFEETRALASGLLALGVGRGDRVGVLSETRREWASCDMAVVLTGAVTVGIYATSTPEQVAYVLSHAEVEIVFVEDPSQLQKLRQAPIPSVRRIILFEGAGEVSGEDVMGLQDLLDLGHAHMIVHPGAFDVRWREVGPEDLAMLVYTSGTTGPPKGVMLTHSNIIKTVEAAASVLPAGEDDLGIIFLPMAHSLQRVAGYVGMYTGTTGVFAERLDKIIDHMQEFKPTIQAAVPRIYEKIHAKILQKVEEATPVRRRLFRWAIDVGRSVSRLEREGRRVPPHLAVQRKLADRLVLSRLRNIFGGRVRYMISGAAPISMELLEFFHACGVLILEGWGLTETTAPATVNRLDRFKFGTVGQDLPLCETKIADDGEILVRGDNVFKGYYKDEAATREAFTDDGWFKTGDIGTKDADGFLRITDRKKEIIITAAGKNISPANIENLLKSTPLVSQSVVFGDRQKYLVALLALDPEEVALIGKRLGISGQTYGELIRHPRILAEVQVAIDRVNRDLARYETIKYFRILDQELSVADDLLTPTLKLKRRNIQTRYSDLISDMYLQAGLDQKDAKEKGPSLW